MNIKEMMIGDWIYDDSNNRLRVTGFGCPFEGEDFSDVWLGVINEDGTYRNNECNIHINDCSPIPLTPEMLELNDFEIIKGRYDIKRYRIIDNDMVVIVEPMKIESRLGNSWFWVTLNHRSDVVQPKMTYPLTDVHVFQHILRHCGLDGLADNFKVE